MERIQAEVNWDYLEANLTQELYQKIENQLGNSGSIMTPYNLEILERWIREFHQLNQNFNRFIRTSISNEITRKDGTRDIRKQLCKQNES